MLYQETFRCKGFVTASVAMATTLLVVIPRPINAADTE